MHLVNGYLPVALANGKTKHYIYIRKHTSADSSAIFVANLPADTTIDNIKDLCSACGQVILDSFEYQGHRRGLIRLVDDAAVTRFLHKASKLDNHLIMWSQYGPRGAEGYFARALAKFPNEEIIQSQVDEYMQEFNELEAEELKQRKGEQVDEDGFTLVVSKRGNPMVSHAPKRQKKSMAKSDFYRFQLREHRKQEMNALLRRFQDDKRKVEELKQRKKLVPY